ncbi:MAG TPA: AmmeMemoRadiSam system protein B [Thermoanaerobaculia bacterium]|nr:AmmeMemoRadiSam system protein B [Thermoanaerobaculia bacterium]
MTSVRPPAVAGTFYEGRPERLREQVRECLPADAAREPAFGAIVPHAGYIYSGPVAGAVFARIALPKTAVILCPNHTGRGAPAALEPSDAWRTPLGDVPVNRRLADRLLELSPSLREDRAAHAREHSLEVQLPFLQTLRPDLEVVPVCLGLADLDLCREVGEAAARLNAEETEPLLLLASSDMNHYEPRAVGRRKDDRALDRVEAIDPEGLFTTILTENISMCGFLPATALLFAARASGPRTARVVARRDSGDETGDPSSVVGYAGVIVT